jgi:hypothetical protein
LPDVGERRFRKVEAMVGARGEGSASMAISLRANGAPVAILIDAPHLGFGHVPRFARRRIAAEKKGLTVIP